MRGFTYVVNAGGQLFSYVDQADAYHAARRFAEETGEPWMVEDWTDDVMVISDHKGREMARVDRYPILHAEWMRGEARRLREGYGR